MALFEGLTGLGGVKVFALSMLAFANRGARAPVRDEIVSRFDRPLPQLPWLRKPEGMEEFQALPPALPEPAPASALASRRRPFRWTPELTAKQLAQWGEKTNHDQPQSEHPVQMHAHRLLLWVNENHTGELNAPPLAAGKPMRGMFGFRLEEIYVLMCFELWWKPLRWEGSNGVGDHFRRLTRHRKKDPGGYRYFNDRDGSRHRLVFYRVPVSAPVSARRNARKTPEPTPKRKPAKQSKRARQPMRKAA